MFRPMCPAFFRCFLSNSGVYIELQTMSFIQSMGVTCSYSVNYNQVQVLSILVLLLTCNNTRILNTCTWLWLTESEQVTPMD